MYNNESNGDGSVFSLSYVFCRCQSLQVHFDLGQCHHASCSDINELRAQRRAWQHNLNHDIQQITLELIVNIFRFCESRHAL